MRKKLFRLGLLALLAALAAPPARQALSLASGLPDHDAYVRTTSPGTNLDQDGLSIASSTADCSPTDTVFLQWDLSGIPAVQTVGSATLTLHTWYASRSENASIRLYQVLDDGWNESTLTIQNAPAVGSLIQTLPAPALPGQTVVFGNLSLAEFLNVQSAGDGTASFALRLAGTCSPGVSMALLYDRESGGDLGPTLEIANPTAIQLRKISAASPISQPALVPVIALLVLLLGAQMAAFLKKGSRV